MSYYEIFGIAAPIASVIAFVPYLRSILKDQTKPSSASWWTWTIITFVVVISSWFGGAPWPVLLLPAWLCLSQLAVAILSLKFGDKEWDVRNKICVGGAILGILLWLLTGNPLLALGLSIISDLFASIPNFRHIFLNPEQEDRLAWTIGWLSAVFQILAIKNWTLAESGWGFYFILNMTLVLFFLYRRKNKKLA
ncbi:MAG: hypothetical protein V1704_04250 [Candidatus Vogelbacteria bacterium]